MIATSSLSPREREILHRLTEPGATRKRVASELGLSEHTIHAHLAHIYCKLGVANLAQAARMIGAKE